MRPPPAQLSQAVRPHPDGAALHVRVAPRSERTGMDGMHGSRLRVRLAASPVDGAANGELVAFVAAACGVRRGDVEIVRGVRSRDKVVVVRGLSRGRLLAVLATT